MKSATLWYHLRPQRIARLLMAVAMLLVTAAVSGQRRTLITGIVVSAENNQPLAGVTIRITGTARGTTTDVDGRYSLDAETGDSLDFHYIGFVSQQFRLGNARTLNVSLKPVSNELNSVVVTAFGNTEKRSDMVGSVTSISTKDLAMNPSSNLTTALAGRAAGLIAFQRSGEPGQDNANFFIRGVTTFGYKTDPLILIDGIELTATDLARIQPDDIASFTILKDATATAVYGARGANGVILITTKEGTVGKAKLSLRFENSISAPTRNIQLADPVSYMKMYDEAVKTRDPLGQLLYSDDKIGNTAKGGDPVIYPANDWRKLLFKDYASTRRVNLNVSGGGGVARYFVSGSYDRDNGLLRVDHRNNFNSNIRLNSYTLRSNVNINVTKTTELTVRLSGNFDDYTGPIDGGTEMYNEVMHSNPVLFPAYYPTDDAHRYVKHIMFGNYQQSSNNALYTNPYADMVKGYKNYSRSLMLAQLEVHQDLDFFTKGLSFKTMVNTYRKAFFAVTRAYNPYYYQLAGYDKASGTYSIESLNDETGTEYLDYTKLPDTLSSSFYLDAMLNYDRTFGKKHGVSAMVVYQMEQELYAQSTDLQQSLPFRNLGISGRTTYDYDKRYYAEFDFGLNGSERFASNHRFGFFPSFGLAWSVSNEQFFKPLKKVVSNLRLRATYGLIGNDAIGSASDRFFYLSNVNLNDASRGATFGGTSGTTYNLSGVSISRYSNDDITWEVAREKNLALEVGLFDHLNITAEYYYQSRNNILMTRAAIPTLLGLTAPIRANVGAATGQGTDISMDFKQYFAGGFWFTAMGNFTYAKSKYKVYEEPHYDEPWRYHVGHSIYQNYGYIAQGLFVDDAEAANSPKQNFGPYGGGDIRYLDVNRDRQITQADMVPIGYPTLPEIVYGFGFSTGYKGLDLSVFFQGLAHESFWMNTAPYSSTNTGSVIPFVDNGAVLKAFADSYWSEDNRNVDALWPRLSTTVNQNDTQTSTFFMRNGSFMRLKQLEVGYSFPQKVQDRLHMSNLRVYVNGSNLLTFSHFKLWDVEMGGNGLGYPIQRVFNVGVNMDIN